ncbi:MAG: hypothetical protein IPJ61_16880 [Tessaracoccus sp.]|uniref:hypothetical protein n=1 Tax=Tessaracoccus sp. TaxID=1971211 RepID=UPI001EC3425B|nr:hypothetical protein [Tessaracoccus sp.]MBK7822687.1 hypothetical protein [Tessaracoccus sp.]
MRFGPSACIALLFVVPQAPAWADDTVPDDVAQVFASEALSAMHDNIHATEVGNDPVDYRAVVGFGRPHEVFAWSRDFLANDQDAPPTRSTNEWIAPAVLTSGDVAGTATAWRPTAGAVAETAGFDGDMELGAALEAVPEDAQVVSDPRSGAWYVIADGEVSALTQRTAAELPNPLPIRQFQAVVAAEFADSATNARAQPGLVWALVAIACCLGILALPAIIRRARNR